MLKVSFVPYSTVSSRYILPSKASTIYLQILSPKPIPVVFICAVDSSFPKSLNSFSLSSSGKKQESGVNYFLEIIGNYLWMGLTAHFFFSGISLVPERVLGPFLSQSCEVQSGSWGGFSNSFPFRKVLIHQLAQSYLLCLYLCSRSLYEVLWRIGDDIWCPLTIFWTKLKW